MIKKEISCNFNSTPNNSNDFAAKPLCGGAAVFSPQGSWCHGAVGGPCHHGPSVPLAWCVTLALFCSTCSALRSQMGISLNHMLVTEALAWLVLAGLCLSPWTGGLYWGVLLQILVEAVSRESCCWPGRSLRKHPGGEKHHFCLLRRLNLARMQSQEAVQLQGEDGTVQELPFIAWAL